MDSPMNRIGGKSNSCKKIVELMPEHSCYVEAFAGACIHPFTGIDMFGGFIKKASDVKVGDIVLTHKGNYKRVTKTFIRDYDGDILLINVKYTNTPLIITLEHPLFTYRRSLHKCKWRNHLPRFNTVHKGCPYKIPSCNSGKKLEFIKSDMLNISDYLLYPICNEYDNIIEKKKIDKYQFTIEDFMDKKETKTSIDDVLSDFRNDDFLELCGFYLAEGGLEKREMTNGFYFASVHFSFNSNEKEYINFVIKTMDKYFNCKYKIFYTEGTNQCFIKFYSDKAGKLFNKFFGHGARNKFIHEIIFKLPIMKLTNMIRSYFYGDGSFSENKNLITATSVSYNLINQMKILLIRLGMLVSYRYTTPEELNKNNIKYSKDETKALFGTNIKSNYGAHTINIWGAEQCNRLFKNLNIDCKYKESESQTHNNQSYGEIDKTYVYMPITKIEKIKYNGKVYNFEVEDDNSYVANGFCVHNCWVLFNKPISKVEVVNDVDGELINFWRVIQRNPDEFIKREQYEMYSRELYEEYTKDFKSGKHKKMSDVERAFRYFVLIKCAFASKLHAGWGYGPSRNQGQAFFNEFKIINEIANRLKRVQIDNKDFEQFIKDFDRDYTLTFADPPYIKADIESQYQCSFTLHDHQRLYKTLIGLKGKFILTIDDAPFIRERYCTGEQGSQGFYWIENTVFYSSADKDNRRHVTELIITNYDTSEVIKQNKLKLERKIDNGSQSLLDF